MINGRRTKSAYLDNDNGEVKTINPNPKKLSKKQKGNIKRFVMLIILIICSVCFYKYVIPMLSSIRLVMNENNLKDSQYESINKTLTNWNIKAKEKADDIQKNSVLLITNTNGYNSEISSIYTSTKSAILIYQNGKEGVYNTKRVFDTNIERIDLDLTTLNNDPTTPETVKEIYRQRFNNLKAFLSEEISTPNQLIEDCNQTILKENELYNTSLTEIENILNENNIPYEVQDNTIQIVSK